MTTQEAYEMMRLYLTRPGAQQAMGAAGGCEYETMIEWEVHRCAVGCLLSPDGLAEERANDLGELVAVRDFEGGLEDLRVAGYQLSELSGVNLVFLSAAQEVHDGENNWDDDGFKVERLDALAEMFRLEVVTDERAPARESVLA